MKDEARKQELRMILKPITEPEELKTLRAMINGKLSKRTLSTAAALRMNSCKRKKSEE